MKLILLVICVFASLQNFAFGRPHLNGDGIVGVSQKNLQEYIVKATDGFKKVMLQGDEELNYPIMDPYPVEDASWDYVDTSSSKKYRLKLFNKNTFNIKGLSNHEIGITEVSAKDMRISFNIFFGKLQTEIPYKLDGYMFKNVMPVYGEGLIKLSANNQRVKITVDLGTDQGFIVVEDVKALLPKDNAEVTVTGFMDLPDSFASLIMDDILDPIVKQHGSQVLTKFARNLVEEAVGGMTTEEFFDYLDHFAKKIDQN